jgi:hypothetical protein
MLLSFLRAISLQTRHKADSARTSAKREDDIHATQLSVRQAPSDVEP